MRTVIFDLDGTLMDTSGDLLAAANTVFWSLGYGDVLSSKTDAGIALRGVKAMLGAGFERLNLPAEELIEAHYMDVVRAYGAAIDVHTVVYPGAIEAVERLKSAGYGVGICTNKPEGLANELIKNKGLQCVFNVLVGADTLRVRKPDPEPLFVAARRAGGDPARCCLVGDSDTDRNTALAANVPSILVTFGPSGEDMAALKPERLLEKFEDLFDMVEGLAL